MSRSKANLGLSRASRLRFSKDFKLARESGQRMVFGCLILNWRLHPKEGTTRLGVVTSKHIGGAVVRNRARRLMREAFRVHQHELDQVADVVLIARRSIAKSSFQQVERDLKRVLELARLTSCHSKPQKE